MSGLIQSLLPRVRRVRWTSPKSPSTAETIEWFAMLGVSDIAFVAASTADA
ncbi:MAG: hypothetical protein KC657_38095 [Myxococcales bacterium]|nr:hypothetical protein [Myxococcales bacterium]